MKLFYFAVRQLLYYNTVAENVKGFLKKTFLFFEAEWCFEKFRFASLFQFLGFPV